jgi:predicted lipoprotein with Yx(FWY)xxD motif
MRGTGIAARVAAPAAVFACLIVAAAPAPAGIPSGDPVAAASEQGTHAAGKRPRLILKRTRYGRVLFSGNRRALYLFTKDGRRKSRCYQDCARAWPPFKVKRRPLAGRGVKPRLIGTTRRAGGARQVTYRGHPLYFYEHDPRGQVLCQNVFEFGGLWLVVNRRGRAVR